MEQTLEKKLRRKRLALVTAGLALSLTSFGGLIYVNKRAESEKPNWSRLIGSAGSGVTGVKEYAHRDGSRSYVSEPWTECDENTRKKGFFIVSDRNNDGFPEQSLTITGCGDGWTRGYEVDSLYGYPRSGEASFFTYRPK